MREFGNLFYLIAARDSYARKLLASCQAKLRLDDRAIIAHTYSTEATVDRYEIGLSPDEFAARSAFGCFVLEWCSGDSQRAAGVEVDRWLDGGLNVLLHGAPTGLAEAQARYGEHLRPVYALGPSGSSGWLSRVLGDGPRRAQISMDFIAETPPIPDPDALTLTGPLKECGALLALWLGQSSQCAPVCA